MFHWGESIQTRCPQIIFCKKKQKKTIYLNVIFDKQTTKPEETQPDTTETDEFCSDKSFFCLFFLNLCSWYYFFCMECCLNRQQIKGKIHSTCQAHATEATGSRQSFFFWKSDDSFVFSPVVPSITRYYTSYECHILHWLKDNQSSILCYPVKV